MDSWNSVQPYVAQVILHHHQPIHYPCPPDAFFYENSIVSHHLFAGFGSDLPFKRIVAGIGSNAGNSRTLAFAAGALAGGGGVVAARASGESGNGDVGTTCGSLRGQWAAV